MDIPYWSRFLQGLDKLFTRIFSLAHPDIPAILYNDARKYDIQLTLVVTQDFTTSMRYSLADALSFKVITKVRQGAVTPILDRPRSTGVKMRSRGQRMFGTSVKGSMTNFKVGQMVKTTLHITGSVNGQHHIPDVIDSYCLFLSPFLQLHSRHSSVQTSGILLKIT